MARGMSVLMSACVVALLAAAPALAAQASMITATGTGQVRVLPQDRHSNSSIASAYKAASRASIPAALKDASANAIDYARGAGLKLGALVSVSDQQNGGFNGPGGFIGPFGPGQFCGTVRQPVFKQVNHREKLIRVKKVHRCFVPEFASTTLTLIYTATGAGTP